MSNIAIIADEADHHPEWFNVYNHVKVNIRNRLNYQLMMLKALL